MPRHLFASTTNAGPALACSNGLFCIAWTDEHQILRVAVSNNGGLTWDGDEGRPVVIDSNSDPETSIARPALAFFNGVLYIAWTGTDNTPGPGTLSVARCTAPGTKNFENKHILWGETSPFAPALAAPSYGLVLLWTGSDPENTLSKTSSPDGVTWPTGNKEIYWGFGSLDGPAVADTGLLARFSESGQLLMAFTAAGVNRRFLAYANITTGGPGFQFHLYNGHPEPGPDTSYWGPSLAYDPSVGATYLGYTSAGPGQNMYVLTQGGGVLSAPSFRDKLVETSPFAPAICASNNGSGAVFLAWTDPARNPAFANYDEMPKIYTNGNG